MKALCVPLFLSALLAAGAATAAQPGPGSGIGETGSARFMLYFQKPMGEQNRTASAARFGFSIERTAGRSAMRFAPPGIGATSTTLRILDLRFAPFAGRRFELNGVRLGSRTRSMGYESYGAQESWNNPLVWLGLGVAGVVGVSCATNNWPCGGDGGMRRTA